MVYDQPRIIYTFSYNNLMFYEHLESTLLLLPLPVYPRYLAFRTNPASAGEVRNLPTVVATGQCVNDVINLKGYVTLSEIKGLTFVS